MGCIYEATGRALFDTLVNISSFWPHVVSLTSTIDSAKPVLRHPARPGELAGALQGTQEYVMGLAFWKQSRSEGGELT